MSHYNTGFPMHFICSSRCKFHIGTIVNGVAVSTVGAFFPAPDSDMETIGSGDDDFYETAVCECLGVDNDLNPQLMGDWDIIKRYPDSRSAETGHNEEVKNREAE